MKSLGSPFAKWKETCNKMAKSSGSQPIKWKNFNFFVNEYFFKSIFVFLLLVQKFVYLYFTVITIRWFRTLFASHNGQSEVFQ
jgi:hypothetical protein